LWHDRQGAVAKADELSEMDDQIKPTLKCQAMPAAPPMVVREVVGASVPVIFLKSHLAMRLRGEHARIGARL
jgi:hypothetical protein